ncbi:hypothetical protein O181_002685 [Austropuccinia psidii MF-1]|uniref:Uncharacterized protein n=1 Tax=Austropuccinia psidii MF-1 TaxID=1389203 RepID=A0A9Q3GD37_9BASI|nr:hypothetical protein [Austropuccinia psidii MF-1]
MQKINQAIMKANSIEGIRVNEGQQIQIKTPPKKMFPKAPKGLPLDFYDIDWFNAQLPAQRKNLEDWKMVDFLNDPNSLLEFKLEDEKLGYKCFNDKNWDTETKDYDLDFISFGESDSTEESDEEYSDYGVSIDFEMDRKDKAEDEVTPTKNTKGKGRMIEGEDVEFDFEDGMEVEDSHNKGFVGGITKK